MKLMPAVSPLSRKGIQVIVITAILYGVLIAITKLMLQFIPGVEMRFVAFIAVAAGICYGPSGAIGAALGNFIGDITYNSWQPMLLFSAILNFFLGYLPYRLWYAIRPQNASLYICSGKTFAKFVVIMAVVAVCIAEVLNAEISIFLPDAGTENFRFGLLFCNMFVFPILFGIPSLLILRDEGTANYYQPRTKRTKHDYQLQALTLLLLLCLAQYSLSFFMRPPLWMDYGLLALGIIIMAYASTIPSAYKPSKLERGKVRLLGSTLTFFLLGLATASVTIYMTIDVITYFDYSDVHNLGEWQAFYNDTLYAIIGVFAIIFILLFLNERDITSRISLLADRTQSLAKAIKKDTSYRLSEAADNTGKEKEQKANANSSFLELKPMFMKSDVPNNEIEELDKSIVDMNSDIKRYVNNLAAMMNEKHALEAQLNIANSIQQGMLPDLGEINAKLKSKDVGFQIHGGMWAAKTVGGDMYDCFFVDDDHLFFMVADVSGKDVPASLFMMVTQTLIFNSKNEIDPAVILASTNDMLAVNNEQALFVTMWVGVVELSTGLVAYVNAGHNPPLIGYKNGEARWLKKISGPVLGIMDGIEYKLYFTEIKKGERLLLYTDGVNEAENGRGGTDGFYGNDRLQEAFVAADYWKDVLADVRAFVGGVQQSDDMTMLWIERG